ncbi:hypothetical protein RM352_004185 [Enterobacter kobei]|nr:hypothetical protein [Enterobacter kobei]
MIRAITLEDGEVMEFKELPTDVQKTAAHTLHSVLRDIGKDIESEPAKVLARNIKAAFIELYQTSKSDGFEKLSEALIRFSMKDQSKNQVCVQCIHTSACSVAEPQLVDFLIVLSAQDHLPRA